MGILLGFLGGNWKWVLPLIVILGLLAKIDIQNHVIESKDRDIAGLNQVIGGLSAQITIQNNAVNALQNAVNNRQKALESSSQLANALQKKHNDQANTIESDKKSLDEKVTDLTSCQKQLKDIKEYMTSFEADHQDKTND